MRARLVFLGVIAVVGCTRNNPAFETGSGETEALTSTEVGGEEEIDTGQEAPDPLCPLASGQNLHITLPGVPSCSDDVLEEFDSWVLVLAPGDDPSTVKVGTGCAPGCGNESCEVDTLVELSVAPLPLADLAPVDSCLHVVGRRATPLNIDSCEFDTVLIERWEGQAAAPILLGRGAPQIVLPPVDSGFFPEIAQFDADLTVADSCTCEEYPDECCGSIVPTSYTFGGDDLPQPVAVGAPPVAIPLDGRDYQFWPLNAFQPGACQGDPMMVSWGLTLKP